MPIMIKNLIGNVHGVFLLELLEGNKLAFGILCWAIRVGISKKMSPRHSSDVQAGRLNHMIQAAKAASSL